MDMLHSSDQIPGKRELNRIRNRQAILSAARECFRDKGYDATTIRDIIRQTDLAAGTFYNYFSNKQDIFSDLLTHFFTQLNESLSQNRRQSNNTRDFIHNAYLALYTATANDPLVYELAHRNARALEELFGSDILGLTMLSLEEDVGEAITRGLLPDVDHTYLCSAFFGVAYETSMTVARRAHKQPDTASEEALRAANFSTNLFLGGIPKLASLS
ncbi:TetR/AcrR family transcriptional regulator [Marinobacter salinexigens]|uniref:TetR/AcrR family transcriptional regulator n=1 Tax=Marinobacter salinexigens TaxID=2919747 RepID=A0A5B0VJV5_9GAMM|nr:TetR/AcrR family transcriptional regulator [Marinobacter salinexigens]KAA1174932.1 TetR/AcrR family transcriptional regulator [Marinobacter salinexigens]